MHLLMERTVLSIWDRQVCTCSLTPTSGCVDVTHVNSWVKRIQVHMSGAVGCHAASLPYLPRVVGCDTAVCSILLGMSVPRNKKRTLRVATRSCFLLKNFEGQTWENAKITHGKYHGRVIITG